MGSKKWVVTITPWSNAELPTASLLNNCSTLTYYELLQILLSRVHKKKNITIREDYFYSCVNTYG